jgi:small Trp-rich protein
MAFLILGILLLAMKLAEFGPVGAWSWWLVLAPFVLAVLWWSFADSIGLTQRRAMDKMERAKVERRNRNLESLGLRTPGERHPRPLRELPAGDASRRAAKDPTSAANDR